MAAKSYSIRLVGTSHYPAAIMACAPGDRIALRRQPDNPHDDQAIVALNPRGATIGYVPGDSWLRRAVQRDGHGCDAWIEKKFASADGDNIGVGILVQLTRGPMAAQPFPASHSPNPRSGA